MGSLPVAGPAIVWAMDVTTAARSLGWDLVERCAGGEFGAHLVERRGERAILKLHAPELSYEAIAGSVALAGRARERGQRVPRYLDVGRAGDAAYTLQAWVAGDLPERLTLPLAREMIDLLGAHAGAAAGWTGVAGFAPWWQPLDVLRAGGPALRALGDKIERVLNETADLALPTNDVVHDDYHFRNLLVAGGSIAAIIDWEAAHAGDRWFDGFLLMWWCNAVPDLAEPAAADWLREVVEEQLDESTLARYAAQMALRILDFFQRTQPGTMDRWISEVDRVLSPYWRH
jgi:hypothetical protein